MNYSELRNELNINSGVVTFLKTNGEKRVMICTRNVAMASKFCSGIGHCLERRDEKLRDGVSMAVVDIEKKDVRAFIFDRVLEVKYFGDLRDESELKKVYDYADKARSKLNSFSISGEEFKSM